MNKLNEIKKFWSAPFEDWEYHEKRDHSQDIEWLISEFEKLQFENKQLKDDIEFFIKRKKVNDKITNELINLNNKQVDEILTRTRIVE